MKEITTNGRAVFYAVLYPSFRKAAMDCGYALALHGSMANDMDILAVPWVQNASSVETLVKAISNCIGETIWKDCHLLLPEEKPHNRIAYSLSIYSNFYIDLSIIKPIQL